MSSGRGRGSLVFGCIMISIGAIFLLQNWYGFFWFWTVLATWWPLLLIGIGLLKIVRYFGIDPQ